MTLLLGAEKLQMYSASVDGIAGWFCDIAGEPEFVASEFAKVQLNNGKQRWVTASRWIDHLAELHHSTQSGRFLDPIRGLENAASSAEQRRILDDLQTVAQALFTDFGSFKDIGFGKAGQKKPLQPGRSKHDNSEP